MLRKGQVACRNGGKMLDKGKKRVYNKDTMMYVVTKSGYYAAYLYAYQGSTTF